MKRVALLLSGGIALGVLSAAPAAAQGGLALKGSLVFNASEVDETRSDTRLSDANGFSVGLEYVLPGGLGVGVSGYTAGAPESFDVGEGSLVMLGEANYFFSFPLLPVRPYLGLHLGLGTYDLDDVRDRVRPEVDFGDRGWQVGLRFQPLDLVGVDAQYRRVSGSLSGEQDASFERNQVLLGVTVF